MNKFLAKLDAALVIFESKSQTLGVLERAASELNISITIIGGMAVAAHGFSRFTQDCDVLITSNNASKLANYLIKNGFSDLGHNKLSKGEIEINICTPDVQTGAGKFPQPSDTPGLTVIDLPHLLAMKLKANRSKDRLDYVELVKANKLTAEDIKQQVLPLLETEISKRLAVALLRRA